MSADSAAPAQSSPRRAVLDLSGITKRFGGTLALDRVDLTVTPGSVHALVGENGAGKSTLGKIAAGIYTPDAGGISVSGRSVGRWDTVRAQRQGIVMIAQELSLVRDLTVAQNVFLGIEEHRAGILRRDQRRRFAALDEVAQFGLDPSARLGDLRIADQQKVEILRALARDAKVIVMDEPTSSLTAHETQRLHEVVRRLTAQGRSVVYVSHFLESVLEVSDTVTVMRDGRRIRTGSARDETKRSLVEAMLGRELAVTFPPRPPAPAADVQPLLVATDMASDNGVRSATLAVRPGEIVGLLGLVGSGRTEIARALVGVDRVTAGTVVLDGQGLGRTSPRRSRDAGLVMVPEDRHGQGLVLARSMSENMTLAFLGRFSRWGLVDRRRERRRVGELVEQLQVRPARPELPVQGFSGGNQQKALLAKWLVGEPRLVILDEPTRGVDVGAKFAIYELIVALARRGVGVLIISSEHEEVLGLAHRAHLVCAGRTFDEVDPAHLSPEDLLRRLFAAQDDAAGESADSAAGTHDPGLGVDVSTSHSEELTR
ncbi:sugar ABC transporter ATP-binding protein [Paenibacillus sp. TRM 82003]|uniref:sugar ABC transporter ATP-binding protein n=1 Tax=Kineococcus sp. TRM81007 TaxID=2925831 RepID=UPI001F58448B|nr:sugar ABC transporter ATP-binding protein [Kineococcus sp. TRM81007]MCI2239038.1 sugar ABC transporter ATP-binding protein [Kineococcus sp. TRM81007]MCI3924458.1 sugar ABC transporter ATP-binding protein [Paenibacillus sp. TRM 82003]